MEITPEIVKRVATNARIKLKEEEIKKFAAEMQEILDAFKKLSEVKTEDVEPSFHPTEIKNITREDKPGKCLDREKALSLTPHRTDKYFKGPKIL
ncbi:Asp-tRNA(Asn)/Glu-tRNA(Gln) amidotransferase subunit GatC [Candidatus Woesearchaeota archaeon]|nr:Asp-tRNA(Asn)/Glu-tRNA(Gln) amidotransferase subunit GatC [Candidatus Woesearchaeota archaeon]